MVKGCKTIFKDKNKLNNLINLRIFGFSLPTLALLHNVHYTALIYHFKKYLIEKPEEVYDIQRIVSSILPPPLESQWIDVDGERINRGRSYKDYLKFYSYISKTKRTYN